MPDLILVIDDEPDLTSTLSFNLEQQGYHTRIAHTGQDGLREAARSPAPALVLLDLMLPDLSGTEVCRRLRAQPETRDLPIVMLTARADEIDRVVGLELGADDYVTKPFSVRELMLRIRSVLRRRAVPEVDAPVVGVGLVRLDTEGHRAWVGGEELGLTALEFKLLTTLMQRRGRVQSREQLLEDVWHVRPDVNSRTVDTHVRRLRSKMGPAGVYIETIRGVGYRFRADLPTAVA